jgi:hypothetical protein
VPPGVVTAEGDFALRWRLRPNTIAGTHENCTRPRGILESEAPRRLARGFAAPDALAEVLAERMAHQGAPALHPTWTVQRPIPAGTREAVDQGAVHVASWAGYGFRRRLRKPRRP